jgi:hypothetical protein
MAARCFGSLPVKRRVAGPSFGWPIRCRRCAYRFDHVCSLAPARRVYEAFSGNSALPAVICQCCNAALAISLCVTGRNGVSKRQIVARSVAAETTVERFD